MIDTMSLQIESQRIGVIPFDTRDNNIAILFVTSQARNRWILPKGKSYSEEKHIDTCRRKAFEEAGVTGIMIENFPITAVITKQNPHKTKKIPVTYYPMLVTKQVHDWPEKINRQRHWALLRDAPKVAYKEDLLRVTQQFHTLAPWVIEIAKFCKDPKQLEQMPAR